MVKAVFLDRDGTINEDVGDLFEPRKLVFIPHAIEGLKLLCKNFRLFIVTNQSGIGRNAFSQKDFFRFDRFFSALLREEGIHIRRTYVCPHIKEEGCVCRKPSPYFLKRAAMDYGIELKKSFVIGDHPHDVEMAHRAGCNSGYLLTGHGKKHQKELGRRPDLVAENLYAAAVIITTGRFKRHEKTGCFR